MPGCQAKVGGRAHIQAGERVAHLVCAGQPLVWEVHRRGPAAVGQAPAVFRPLGLWGAHVLRGVVWCGVVWCGVVWCGVVWCGVVWCGVVWCGVVWCGCARR